MKVETIKAATTYGLASFVVVFGGIYLGLAGLSVIRPNDLITGAIIGFIGSQLAFLTGKETATATARQTESAVKAGSVATSTPSATATAEAVADAEADAARQE